MNLQFPGGNTKLKRLLSLPRKSGYCFFLLYPQLVCWRIRHTCVHGASLLANNITKQGKGGSFLYLTVSFSKGTRIYPPVTIHTPQKKLWKWICMQLVSTSPTAHYKWSRAGGEFSHWDLKPSEL